MENSQSNTAAPSFATPKFGLGGVNGTGATQLFDVAQFDTAIAQRGVKLIHTTAMPCPVGRNSKDDSTRRSHPDHAGCQGGFIFTPVGEATCLFTNNTKNKNWMDQGLADSDHVFCTLPRYYDNTQIEVKAVAYDRFYLSEPNITVVQWELVDWSGSGYDSLKFPAVSVQTLIDWQGNYYKQDQDFTVVEGRIKWNPNKGPGLNAFTGKGSVYSVRYTYRPYYIVDAISHEIRVANQINPVTGEKYIVAMPYSVSLVRENARRNADNDPLSPAAQSRQQLSDSQVDFSNNIFVDTENEP